MLSSLQLISAPAAAGKVASASQDGTQRGCGRSGTARSALGRRRLAAGTRELAQARRTRVRAPFGGPPSDTARRRARGGLAQQRPWWAGPALQEGAAAVAPCMRPAAPCGRPCMLAGGGRHLLGRAARRCSTRWCVGRRSHRWASGRQQGLCSDAFTLPRRRGSLSRHFSAGGCRRSQDSDDSDHPLQGWGFSSPGWDAAYRSVAPPGSQVAVASPTGPAEAPLAAGCRARSSRAG